MTIPIAQIISAAAPLVMNAVELYRRRREAGAAGGAAAEDAVQRQLHELEQIGLEQSRLIVDLSRSLEALARNHEETLAEMRRKEVTIHRLLIGIGVLATVSLVLAIWALARS